MSGTTNVNSADNKNSLWGEIPIENSPFKRIGNDEKGWVAAIGRHRITDAHQTPEKVKEWMEENVWTVIFNIVATMIEINEEGNRVDKMAALAEEREKDREKFEEW